MIYQLQAVSYCNLEGLGKEDAWPGLVFFQGNDLSLYFVDSKVKDGHLVMFLSLSPILVVVLFISVLFG